MEKDNLLACALALAIMIPLEGFLLTRAASEDKIQEAATASTMDIAEHPRNYVQLGAITGELDPAIAERLIQDPTGQE